MKGFMRKNLLFSLCGLNCGLCTMRLGGHCPGCGGGPGNQSCAIAKCSLQHGCVEYCFLCSEFPCPKYDGAEEYDSFVTHQRQLKDIKRAQEIGIEAYSDEQTEKANILHTLLSDYNDGRRKTFFCAAVNLIPLEQLRTIMEQAAANGPHTLKEKAEYVAALFRSYAEKNGLVLGLRRKPAML
ncbi:MAG: DUF3795 domain-containing protein [Clostridiales bacterium]|mgnify:FL=1|nr:DUF3795 domain-containing protein [Clostridiales bacterium]